MEVKVLLKIKDVEIKLTIDELNELKNELDKLLSNKIEFIPYRPIIDPNYYTLIQYELGTSNNIIINPTITCCTSGGLNE